MLTARKIREIRSKVFEEELRPHGFERGTYMYIRHSGRQLHGIDIQTEGVRQEYTINLSFHFDYIRPYLNRFSKKPLTEYTNLDFGLNNRLGILAYGFDKWWKYPESIDQCRSDSREIAISAIRYLNECEVKWMDPEKLLNALTPSLLDSYMRGRENEVSIQDSLTGVGKEIFEWSGGGGIVYFLVSISVFLKKYELAKKYIAVGRKNLRPDSYYLAGIKDLMV